MRRVTAFAYVYKSTEKERGIKMFVINVVLSAAGPEITVTVGTLDDVITWFADHRPEFGYWDWLVTDSDGNTVPDSLYIK